MISLQLVVILTKLSPDFEGQTLTESIFLTRFLKEIIEFIAFWVISTGTKSHSLTTMELSGIYIQECSSLDHNCPPKANALKAWSWAFSAIRGGGTIRKKKVRSLGACLLRGYWDLILSCFSPCFLVAIRCVVCSTTYSLQWCSAMSQTQNKWSQLTTEWNHEPK
jgi:hypothetical protein